MIALEKYTEFHSPGYVIEMYNNGQEKEIIYGNCAILPKRQKCTTDTLYDIASLTKVFTATLIYIAYEEEKIDIYASVSSVDTRFLNLNTIRIIDLLSHNQEIYTDGYLGDAKNKEEFYTILFSAYVKNDFPTYVDAHYIILSTILEKIYNASYDEIVTEKIIKKLNLSKTTFTPKGDNIASNNYENTNGRTVEDIFPGLIHDTKARVAKTLGIYTGHASIFTTGKELLEFLKSFLDASLLKKETIELMLSHQDRNKKNIQFLKSMVPEQDVDTMYEKALLINPNINLKNTYNNMGLRYRNEITSINDVPKNCSSTTVTFSGYTGPAFLIDFEKKSIVIVMCNVMHRTTLSRIERKKYTYSILSECYDSLL